MMIGNTKLVSGVDGWDRGPGDPSPEPDCRAPKLLRKIWCSDQENSRTTRPADDQGGPIFFSVSLFDDRKLFCNQTQKYIFGCPRLTN